jgi:flagellar hook assembly protein FlgD/outer membrane protein OmpA-like peptidoglycan-associated protein
MKVSVRAFSLLAAALLLGALPVFGQNEVFNFYSPGFLGGGTGAGSTASPQADAVNPAASGGAQRMTAELSYLALLGLGSSPGWGNIVNGGFTLPTTVGVFTGSARLLNAAYPALNFGTLGSFNLSFAKDLFPELYVGAGLGFQIGSDWGLGLDLGFVHLPGDLAFLKDFRWGIALRGLGKWYPSPAGAAGVGSIPPVFTPDIGASFALIKTDPFTLTLAPDLSFPTFVDMRVGLGLRAAILDTVFIDGSFGYDVKDSATGKAPSLPIGIGVTVKLQPLIGSQKSDLLVSAAAAPLQDGVWGIGAGANLAFGQIDRTPPKIEADLTAPAYISPGTASAQTALTVPFTLSDERYIKGYRLIVSDSQGSAVRTIQAADEGPSSTGFQNILDRLLTVKKSMPVPESVTWDGRNDAGAAVPDGPYTYVLESWDDNRNLARTEAGSVTVDTGVPTVTVSAPYLEFSPSGESTKGILQIQQSGSPEDLWVGTVYDSTGREVRQFRWTGEAPKPFEWRGRDSTGRIVPDGTYTYRIMSTDRAGNTGSAELANIVINTQATPVSLSTDLPAFSPNGDGIKDVIKLLPEVKIADGIEKWTLSVRDQAGTARRSFSGQAPVPASVTFDGKDDAGARLAEGNYRASLNVVYRNGRTPNTDSPPFLLRVTPPSARVSAAYNEFSPDGVGRKTALPVDQGGSSEVLWTGTFRSSAGQALRSLRWDESAPKSFAWDGRDDSGRLVPDGVYTYKLSSTDPAGNTGSAALERIVVNTTATPAAVSIDDAAFSPNGDGVKDTLGLTLGVPVTAGMEKWTLAVQDSAGKAKRIFTGSDQIPARMDFDGRDEAGTALPEGQYTAALSLSYANGHDPSAVSPPFVIDVTAPSAAASSDFTVFSPGGARPQVTFTQSGAKDAAWAGTVKDASGKAVFTAFWKDAPSPRLVFDGRGDDGKPLADGKYTYQLAGTDRAGNVGRSALVSFEIDTTKVSLSLSTDLTWFSPNGDGVKDVLRVLPSRVPSGLVSYELRLVNDKGVVVRRSAGKDAAPSEFAWDGLDDSKVKVPDGQYLAEMEALFRNGDRPVVRTAPFYIKTVPPSVTVAADTLLFSPAEGSAVTAVTIRQSSSAEDEWQGLIQDAAGKPMRGLTWQGKAVDFTWDGKDNNGNVVPDGLYRYVVSSTDRAGNRTVRTLDGIRVDTRPTPVSVKAASDGFSPNGDGYRDTIGFNLSVGLPEGISSWRLSMVEAAGGALKVFSGQGKVPETLFWDGRTDAGKVVEGSYTAQLEVGYAKGNRPSAKSDPFLLSVTPPKVGFDASPLPFSPDGDGFNDLLAVTLKAESASGVDSWDIQILDPEGHPFISFSGKGAPEEPFTWDGLSANGELVEAAQDYTFAITVKDLLGNVAAVKKMVPIDVLVIRDGDRLKVRITSITFQANTADYSNVPADRAEKNTQTLKRLAQIFNRYSQYKIRIEGHAVMVNWDKPAEGKKEQETVLLPLSKARADSIKSALVKLGIDARRVTTEGIGGAQPIVPFSDLENRWKDRRVEFILIRE